MEKRSFGELELAVLHVLESGERMTVKEVHHKLGEENKYTTIMTVMSRLAEKEVIMREKVGASFEYWLVPAQGKIASFIDHFRKKIFGVKSKELICHLIEHEDDISDKELEEMQSLLEKARLKRKKKGS